MIEVVRKLDISTQRDLIEICRTVIDQAPLFQKTMPTGAKFRYLCTSAGDYGWTSDRKGFRYVDTHPLTNTAFPPMPAFFMDIAVNTAQEAGLNITPQSALINWYTPDSTLGLHQDRTERCDAPVISISLGDDCKFVIGGLQRSDAKRTITLQSSDVLLMGAEHRYVFHGIKKILPDTAPADLGLKQPGRVNITIRQVHD